MITIFCVVLCLLVLTTSLVSISSSTLYTVTSVRSLHTDFNISSFNPVNGTLSAISSLSLADGYLDVFYGAVFQPSTQSLLINHETQSNTHQWIHWSVEKRAVTKIGSVIKEAPESPGCFFRDDVDGVTWSLTFDDTSEEEDTVIATLFKYPDQGESPLKSAFALPLIFTYWRLPIPLGCAYNAASKSLYFVLNDKTPYLYTFDMAKGRVASIQWPPGPDSRGVYGLAYSNKQQKLYAFVTTASGIGGQSIVAVDPVSGKNETIISSGLTPDLFVTTAFDQDTDHWFIADLDGGQWQFIDVVKASIVAEGPRQQNIIVYGAAFGTARPGILRNQQSQISRTSNA